MRPLEILLLFTFLPVMGLPFIARRTRRMVYVAVLPLLFVAIQVIFEGYRWQLVPAYTLAVIVLLVCLPQLLHSDSVIRHRRRSIVGSVVGLLIIGLSALLAQVLPVFSYPNPTGEYAVGTTARSLHDDTRNRNLMVQLWYPTKDIANAKRAPYLPEVEKLAPALMTTMGMPSFTFDHMRYIESHSYEDAPLEPEEAFPVLLFSHGLSGYRHQSVAQMEELASHGYIVVSVDHTNYASAVVFPDGSVKAFALEDEDDTAMREVWKADQHFVFSQITLFNESDPLLKEKLDLTRVGTFGHSFGGATLTFFCEDEPLCLASVNMDGSMSTTDDQSAWQKPFAYLMSDDQFNSQPELTDDQLLQSGMTREEYERIRTTFVRNYQRNYELKGEQGYWLHIEGTKHQNFSDMPFASPLFGAMGATGSIAPTRSSQIINDYLLAFFDTYLKGEPSTPLITGESPDYPEIHPVMLEDLPSL